MLLCCPLRCEVPCAPEAQVGSHFVDAVSGPSIPALPAPAGERCSERLSEPTAPAGAEIVPSTGQISSEAQRAQAAERDCQHLRIENAELKKRMRFRDELFQKEILHLRVEIAELKKRLYPSHHAVGPSGDGQLREGVLRGGVPMGQQFQTVWVPVVPSAAIVVNGGVVGAQTPLPCTPTSGQTTPGCGPISAQSTMPCAPAPGQLPPGCGIVGPQGMVLCAPAPAP